MLIEETVEGTRESRIPMRKTTFTVQSTYQGQHQCKLRYKKSV